jgi:hypothetical protein
MYLEADTSVRLPRVGGFLLRWPQTPHRSGEPPHGRSTRRLLLARALVAVTDAPSKLRSTGPAAAAAHGGGGGRCRGDGGSEQAAAAGGSAKRGGRSGGARHCCGLGFRRRCGHGGRAVGGGGEGNDR